MASALCCRWPSRYLISYSNELSNSIHLANCASNSLVFNTEQGGAWLVRSDAKLGSKQIMTKLPNKFHKVEQFFPCDAIVSRCFTQGSDRKSNRVFHSILHPTEDGSNAVIVSVFVQYELNGEVRVRQDRGGG